MRIPDCVCRRYILLIFMQIKNNNKILLPTSVSNSLNFRYGDAFMLKFLKESCVCIYLPIFFFRIFSPAVVILFIMCLSMSCYLPRTRSNKASETLSALYYGVGCTEHQILHLTILHKPHTAIHRITFLFMFEEYYISINHQTFCVLLMSHCISRIF